MKRILTRSLREISLCSGRTAQLNPSAGLRRPHSSVHSSIQPGPSRHHHAYQAQQHQFQRRHLATSSLSQTQQPRWRAFAAITAITAGVIVVYGLVQEPIRADASNDTEKQVNVDGPVKYIRLKELKKHGASAKSIWVSRGTAVYDISSWIEGHPGGSVIMRAAGGALEPYWSVFSFHSRPDILEILEEFKIGEVRFPFRRRAIPR